jgi:hypothetical protein
MYNHVALVRGAMVPKWLLHELDNATVGTRCKILDEWSHSTGISQSQKARQQPAGVPDMLVSWGSACSWWGQLEKFVVLPLSNLAACYYAIPCLWLVGPSVSMICGSDGILAKPTNDNGKIANGSASSNFTPTPTHPSYRVVSREKELQPLPPRHISYGL